MEAIYRAGTKLELAMTLEDHRAVSKSGRAYIDDFCAAHGVPLVKVRNINDEGAVEAIRASELDWLFIIGWSQIARIDVLAAPRRGVVGIHPTLLPTGRGRAAIPWAILLGLEETGVTLFQMDEGIDTGPILGQVRVPIGPRTDAGELYRAIDAAHVALIERFVPALDQDRLVSKPQDDAAATEWPGRRPEDGALDPGGSVADAERLVRAVTRPYPGAFFDDERGRVTVWRAHIAAPGEMGEQCRAFADGMLMLDDWEMAPTY